MIRRPPRFKTYDTPLPYTTLFRSGPLDTEILEIGGRIDQHLAGAVVAVEIVALSRLDLLRPAGEVVQLFLRLLGEQVVGDANGQLSFRMQFLDDAVIARKSNRLNSSH